jgi:hypothetical protein
VLVLFVLSLGMWWSVFVTGHPSSTVVCQCGDPALNIWFVKWAEWSVAHLHNPFLSNAIFAGQGGANTLDTDSLLPGFVMAPVTVLFGPIASFNLLGLLVPIADGWAMFVFLRKVSSFFPAQLLGSLLYAFAPSVVGNAVYGHFNVDFTVFPPLIAWCLYDLLADRRHRPAFLGAGAGLLVAGQFLLGPEQLAMTALVVVIMGLFSLVLAPRRLAARWRELARSGLTGGTLGALLVAYPAWWLLAGPRHTSGYPWPGTPDLGITLSGLVEAGRYALPTRFGQATGNFGPAGPPLQFLGVALVSFLGLSAIVWRRRRVAWCALALGAVGVLLGLGAGYHRSAAPWPPWRLLEHIPVLGEILPQRFGLFVDFAAATLLTLSVEGWWQARRLLVGSDRSWIPRRARTSRVFEMTWTAAFCAAGAAVLVPIGLTEPFPLQVHNEPPPGWFVRVAPSLRPGTRLLVFPNGISGLLTNEMAWQAEDSFRYSMVGGYALVPGADGHSSDMVDPLGGTMGLMSEMSFSLGPLPGTSRDEIAAMTAALRNWKVNDIIVTDLGRSADDVGFFTALLGRPPRFEDGVWVWYGVGHPEPLVLSSYALSLCTSEPSSDPLAVADCALEKGRPLSSSVLADPKGRVKRSGQRSRRRKS